MTKKKMMKNNINLKTYNSNNMVTLYLVFVFYSLKIF